MKIVRLNWSSSSVLPSKSYICGYCGNSLASDRGFFAQIPDTNIKSFYIYICHFCFRPTYFDMIGNQTPGFPYGNTVNNIPSEKYNRYCVESQVANSPLDTIFYCKFI